MKFGVFFEQQLPRPWQAGDERKLFHDALEQVTVADRIGVAHAWAQEHHFLEEYSHSSAPEVFLAACSQRTKKIRLGHGITLMPPAYNHPARVAERIATLDIVSDGRVDWGTGESSSRIELEAFGANYVDKRAMWEEATRECARMMSMTPYPGHAGRYFSMPARNVVPKPLQSPHPPLWVACSNRDTMKLAARFGMGALTFAFMDATEAKYWVDDYYETFKKECTPIGRVVNPNIAMLSGFLCHPDGDTARTMGEDGQRFFAYGLSHFYRTGTHVPGRSNLWEKFKETPPFPIAGTLGLGSPDEIRKHFRAFEDAGVDQLILLQQAGNYQNEEICKSLELFGKDVLPEFLERQEARERRKMEELAPYIERAYSKIPPLQEMTNVPEVESYPALLKRTGIDPAELGANRSMESAALWRLSAGGSKRGAAKG